MRIKEMITQDLSGWNFNNFFPLASTGNVQEKQKRIWILIIGFKGLTVKC